MNTKAIGSILMILGTSIGAGMLALPIVTAHEHIGMSIGLLFFGWALMTIGAFSLLEINLWLEPGSNLISMSEITLGRMGKILMWIVYLLLLYSLICAYLSGVSDVIQGLLASVKINLTRSYTTIIGLFIFGFIVYRGVSSVDIVNRALMGLKLLSFLFLSIIIAPHIHFNILAQGDWQWRIDTFMVILTSFGYAIIIPTLRQYLDSDRSLLIKVIIIGSLLPLLIYILWITLAQGMIPRVGEHGMIAMQSAKNSNTMLMQSLSAVVNIHWLDWVSKLFISICAMTSFLGVSICLTDFIADGLNKSKTGFNGALIYGISFLPPLIIVLLAPGIFLHALAYAGICCLILLIILPVVMLWRGRKQFVDSKRILPGGIFSIVAVMLVGIVLLLMNVWSLF